MDLSENQESSLMKPAENVLWVRKNGDKSEGEWERKSWQGIQATTQIQWLDGLQMGFLLMGDCQGSNTTDTVLRRGYEKCKDFRATDIIY